MTEIECILISRFGSQLGSWVKAESIFAEERLFESILERMKFLDQSLRTAIVLVVIEIKSIKIVIVVLYLN